MLLKAHLCILLSQVGWFMVMHHHPHASSRTSAGKIRTAGTGDWGERADKPGEGVGLASGT